MTNAFLILSVEPNTFSQAILLIIEIKSGFNTQMIIWDSRKFSHAFVQTNRTVLHHMTFIGFRIKDEGRRYEQFVCKHIL